MFFGGSRPSLKVAIGVALGIAGIVLLIGPTDVFAGTTELNLFYLMGLIFAPIFWSIGSLISRKSDLPPNVFMANASEMLCGGAVVLLVSIFFGEPFAFQISQVETKAWYCMLYLTIFGSMIALTAYAWLLKNAPAAKVATYSYVNPVIALFLGWLILSEQITWQTALAVVVIIAGVVLIVTDKTKSLTARTSEEKRVEPIVNFMNKEREEPCEIGA